MYLKLDESKWYRHTQEWSDRLEGIGKVEVYKGQIEVVEDVVPIVHAHWIEDRGDLICSNCYECYSDEIVFMSRCKDVYDLPHCPECGAKMDEEVNNG